MAADSQRSVRLITLLAVLAAAAGLLRFNNPEYAIDDAFITFRTARTWLETGVPTYDATQPATEGSTTTSWMFLSAAWVAALPELNPMIPARLLGAAFHLLTAVVLVRLAAKLAQRASGNPAHAAAATALAFGASTWLSFHAVSGMETALYNLIFALLVDRVFELNFSLRRSLAIQAGVLSGLLATTRPEGVLVALLIGVWLLVDLRPAVGAWAIPTALIIGALELWRWHHYQAWVPNTFHAKPPSPLGGLRYAARFALFGVGIAGVLPAIFAARALPQARRFFVGLAALTAATVLSGGDWMPGFRRLSVIALGLMVLTGVGVAVVSGRHRWLVRAAALGWVLGNSALIVRAEDGTGWDTLATGTLGKMAEASGLKQVGLSDIGAFGWYFKGSVYDLYGLTDRRISSARGKHGAKEWDEAYFLERRPEVVALRSDLNHPEDKPEQRSVMTNEQQLANYLLRSSDYRYRNSFPYGNRFFWVFVRNDITLPTQIWGKPAP